MNVHECILHVPGCVHVGQSVESMAAAAEGKWQIQELVLLSLVSAFCAMVTCVVRELIRKVIEISLIRSEIHLVLFLGV